ncbi:protein kinase [Nonomuraea sp. NPDC050540]|uniref:protein kinase domain-containing protein n=1 Tax=Nonomuraea sp. NPDC050540 TaxID=3364367 RepID=UPI0037A0AED9
MPEPRPLRPGEPAQLGDYRLIGCIGEGGQGIVYLARAPTGVRVAIKVLQGQHADDEEARRRFLREIEAASTVAPFCTARVLHYTMADGRPYVVSEFIDGPSLQQRVASAGPLEPGELERLAIGTAAALVAIHRAGIIHRDFKPANVLLGPDGPRVVDFGIARILDTTTTSVAGIVGTPSYMSPEQASDARVGTASDLFAWAGTMIFAATGNPPFGRSNLAATVHRILNHPGDVSGLPKQMQALVGRCLDKTPEQRPSAREVLLALVGEPSGSAGASMSLNGEDPEELVAAAARMLASPPSPQALASRTPGPASALAGARPAARRIVSVVMSLVVVGAILVGVRLFGSDADPSLPAGTAVLADRMFAAPPDRSGKQVLNAVAASGDVVVAAGSDTTGAVPRPLFLSSRDDGRTWQLGDVAGQGGPERGPATVNSVVRGDGRWLAVGDDDGPAGKGMWTSADGHTWTAVAAGGLTVFRDEDRIMAISKTSSGFVAVGSTVLDDDTERPAAWTSADGVSWARTESTSIGKLDAVRRLTGVIAKGSTVLAVGEPPLGALGAVALRSRDAGRTWLPSTPPFANDYLLSVASDAFVLVPASETTPKGVEVSCSSEGVEWSPCGWIGTDNADHGVARLLSFSSKGVAALMGDMNGPDQYAVYTSADGRVWNKSVTTGATSGDMRALAVTDSGTFVLSGDRPSTSTGGEPVLMTARPGEAAARVALQKVAGWTRLPAEVTRLAAAGGRYLAVGAAAADAGIWTSADGRTWSRVEGPEIDGAHLQRLSDVAYGGAGWLTAGLTMDKRLSTRPLLLASADGRSWRRIEITDSASAGSEHPVQALHALAAGRSGYVIAGSTAAGPVLLFTTDLRKLTRSVELPASESSVRIHDVAPTVSGYAAVGGSGSAGHENAVVWVSMDGRAWTARPWSRPPGLESAELEHVVAVGDQITAVGSGRAKAGEQRPFAVVSTDDGRTWKFTWLPAEREAAVQDVVATAKGLVAVGLQGTNGESDSIVWTSQDGLDWRDQPLSQPDLSGAGAQWLNTIAISGADVVAIGRSSSYRTDHLTLWRTVLGKEG